MPSVTTTAGSRPAGRDPILDLRGWVQVGVVDEVRARGPIVVRRFARDVVVWCDERGDVHAVAAPEPRSDQVGGRSRGEAFTGLPVAVLGGIAFVYRRAPGDAPSSTPPPLLAGSVVEEALLATGTHRSVYRIAYPASLVSFLENAVDDAHFPTLHGSTVRHSGGCDLDIAEDGTMRCVVTLHMKTVPGRTAASRTDIVCPTPFASRTRFTVAGKHHDLVALAGPIGDHTVEVLFVSQSSASWRALSRPLHALVVRNEKRLMNEDVEVLATRTVPSRPILSEVDGPILAVHRWIERFRAPADAGLEAARDVGSRSGLGAVG